MASLASFVYVTCGSKGEALKIGRRLVTENLCACVNVIENMHSIYRWKGKIESVREVILIIKIQRSRFARVEKRIRELHSYDVPCVLEIPVTRGSRKYLDWLTTRIHLKP
jgi:periplasmic divalent cation tolerance protein